MTLGGLANLSFEELRSRLKLRIDALLSGSERHDGIDDEDLESILTHLLKVPISASTSATTEALIHLASNFSFIAQPARMLAAASRASEIAAALGDRLSLCRARNKTGFALTQLGRIAEATVAQADAWSLARELEDKGWEVRAIWGFSTICVAMGQWNVALRYCELMRDVAREFGFHDFEFIARNNAVDCAIQLRDPVLGLRLISESLPVPLNSIGITFGRVQFHINLGRLYLLLGDLKAAESAAAEAAYLAAGDRESAVRDAEALCGVVSIARGDLEGGLAKVNRYLAFAKLNEQHAVPAALSMCIDAYEAAGDFDRALAHLQELVDWKKQLIDAQMSSVQLAGLSEPVKLEAGASLLDEGILEKAHLLGAGVQKRVHRLLEMAINAEVASAHDIFRPFRLAKLAREFSQALGWDSQRQLSLGLAAQFCNIGMIAIPARILFSPGSLSNGARRAVHNHAHFGAEILRKSKLRALNMASIVAEQHHERWDGSGYPSGICAKEIAEEARVVAICDVFDAMTHQRPWRQPLPIELALREIERGKGTQFDASAVDVFNKLIHRLIADHGDLDTYLSEDAAGSEYARARKKMETFMNEYRTSRLNSTPS